MPLRSVRTAAVAGRSVLVRVDHNVPLADDLTVADDRRIVESLPTLQFLRDHRARLVLMSHLGRPDGKPKPKLSLAPVARRLGELMGVTVPLLPTRGPATTAAVKALKDGGMVYLENLRFDPGEESNDPAFAADLAALGEIFVEEAFGTVHRAHASTVGVPQRLPAYAGFLVEKEVAELTRLMKDPEHPFIALLGGAKVKDKLPLIRNLCTRADTLLIGGALALPFLVALGGDLGGPAPEPGLEVEARLLLEEASKRSVTLRLPLDFIVETSDGRVEEAPALSLPKGSRALDIGPRTRTQFKDHLRSSRTVFWNGPLGKIEDPRFLAGTREVLQALVGVPGTHISAGGDSARTVQDLGVEAAFQYISTGGGAALELLEGRDLPGLAVIPSA